MAGRQAVMTHQSGKRVATQINRLTGRNTVGQQLYHWPIKQVGGLPSHNRQAAKAPPICTWKKLQ